MTKKVFILLILTQITTIAMLPHQLFREAASELMKNEVELISSDNQISLCHLRLQCRPLPSHQL